MYNEVFVPNTVSATQIKSQRLTAGASSLRVAVNPGSVIRLVNTHATQTAHINFGKGAEDAVVAVDMVVPPAYGEVFIRVPQNANSMSYIASGANTYVYMTEGA